MIAVSSVACSQISKEVMDAVTKAREEARTLEAEVYAKESFIRAETLFKEMNAEIEERSFESAEQHALDAKKAFVTASIDAKKMKETLASDIPVLVEKAAAALISAEELYTKNKASLKAKKFDLNALVSDLQVLKNALVEAQSDGKSSKLMDAKVKLDGIIGKLAEIAESMNKALEK